MNLTYREFWDWFLKNEGKFRRADAVNVVAKIQRQLSKINARLAAEVSIESDPRELVITAHGDQHAFPSAMELGRSAPVLPDWTIQILKPARGFEFSFERHGVEIDARKLQFDPITSASIPDSLGIRVYVPDISQPDEQLLAQVSVIVETGIGEDSASRIEHLEVAPAPPPDAGALSLDKLGAYIQWWDRKRNAEYRR